jgi:hypothetical protein
MTTPNAIPDSVEAKKPSAPTPALVNPTPPSLSEPFLAFYPFPRLPAEIRAKVWALLNPPPQILHVNYGIHDRNFRQKYNWNGLLELHGEWMIMSPKLKLVNLSICQESRYEGLKAYSVINLLNNITQRVFFNFATDTLFLNTNELKSDQEKDKVLPPRYVGSPFPRSVGGQVRRLAVSKSLWVDWPFLKEVRGDMACAMCDGVDETHRDFQYSLKYCMPELERVQIVPHGALIDQETKEFHFVKNEWHGAQEDEVMVFTRELFGSGVEVESVDLGGWVIDQFISRLLANFLQQITSESSSGSNSDNEDPGHGDLGNEDSGGEDDWNSGVRGRQKLDGDFALDEV